jgi:RHS repeat-associated protein
MTGDYANKNLYRFGSKALDARSELSYYGYRFFSFAMGRWINRDPIEERGGLALYSYVQNSPLARIDILGLLPDWFDGGDERPPEGFRTEPLPPPEKIQICIRPLNFPVLNCTTMIVHCYLDLDGGETYAYDKGGVHPDTNPNSFRKDCKELNCKHPVSKDGLKAMINIYNWAGSSYDLTKNNCCHWVDDVLRALGCDGAPDSFPGYTLPNRHSR